MNAEFPGEPPCHSFSFAAMGTDCAIHLYARTPAEAEAAAAAAMAEVLRIEARYSRFRSDSDLSAINRVAAAGGLVTVDAETAALLDYAVACHAHSDGLLDITSGLLRRAWDFSEPSRPPAAADIAALLDRVGLDKVRWERPHLSFLRCGMEIDFGGIGKEYAADQAVAACLACGVGHGLVDLGGDLAVIGPHPSGAPWRIGIRHPRQADSVMAEVLVAQGGVATSGDYERCVMIDGRRHGHILDPRTGWPSQGLASVSVVAGGCLPAGSLSTIAMLKGRDAIPWLAGLGVRHLWMDEDGRIGGDTAAFLLPAPVTP